MTGQDESVERERQVGRNESVFRAVNAQIEVLNEIFAVVNTDFTIVCECGDISCADQIPILSAEYARVRTDRTLFFVVPGHEDATVEVVVQSDRAAYLVVRKPTDSPAEIAANAAPEYLGALKDVRRDAIDTIAKNMRRNGMSSKEDFEDLHHSMLPEQGEDFLASGLMSIAWRDVKKRLEEIS